MKFFFVQVIAIFIFLDPKFRFWIFYNFWMLTGGFLWNLRKLYTILGSFMMNRYIRSYFLIVNELFRLWGFDLKCFNLDFGKTAFAELPELLHFGKRFLNFNHSKTFQAGWGLLNGLKERKNSMNWWEAFGFSDREEG